MIKVRLNCFETNSSSSHSLVMCDDSTYQALLKEEAFVVGGIAYLEKVVSKEELLPWVLKNYKDEWQQYCSENDLPSNDVNIFIRELKNQFNGECSELEYEVHTFNQVLENDILESYHQSFTTKDGEIIHAFGAYGYEG